MTIEPTVQVSLDEAQHSLAHCLAQVGDQPMLITEHGSTVGVIVSPVTFAYLRCIQAYFEMLQLSRELQTCGINAQELFRLTREEAEVRA